MAWLNHFNTKLLITANDFDEAMKLCRILDQRHISYIYKPKPVTQYTTYNIDTIWMPAPLNHSAIKHLEEHHNIYVRKDQYDEAVRLLNYSL